VSDSDLDLSLMRKSGHILAETLRSLVNEYIVPGITAKGISDRAEEIIRSYDGAIPAFVDYNGFKWSACVSVNEQVVHSIPTNKVLKDGDIVSVDCGVLYHKHYTDACRTVGVGKITDQLQHLLDTTDRSLSLGIEKAVVGGSIGDISYAIQKHVERNGFDVSLEFVGHGIGKKLHQQPCVPNYGLPGGGQRLESGTCLAIEPVVFDGPTDVILNDDGWTIISQCGNMSAHFEDTIIITEKGPEIITR